ncbi:chemotaxis protein CheA [Niveibacterium sp. SC-1]|uniref:chemotaxis protein CheA n=1 Tax=Niveibacterium sp. SC-1 TaxID=3135646 RepID=UPI00311FACF2
MDFSAARGALVQEARELLAEMERALLEIEAEGIDAERVNAAFRAAHTIKGSAGLFGLDLIVSFTHVMESVLERVRSGTLGLDGALVSGLLRCGDYLGQLINAVEAGEENADPDPAGRKQLLDLLRGVLGATSAETSVVPDSHESRVERDPSGPTAGNEHWHLSLRFGADVLRNGMDPLSFIHYLQGLGEILHLYTISDDLPEAADFDPESCYLGFEIDLLAETDKQTLDSVFEFVREDSRIRILPPRAKISEYITLIEAMHESRHRLGEILIAGGTLTQAELDEVLRLQGDSLARAGTAPRLGEMLVQEQMVEPAVVSAALSKQKQAEEKRGVEQRIIKVEAAKLDQLINLVGELVIASAGARLLSERTRQATLVEAMGEVAGLVEQIRDRALNLRMIQIGEVFQRFPRVVRDVSQELGKRIELAITGAETELDKSMVEKLGDPLLHIVRNAMDHGIEPVDERRMAEKPDQGRLALNAFHESGCIVIEVSDDGRGLDDKRIRAKAIERGLISADAELSEHEIHQLIFAPGFSTAEQITNLSGRGVGMDVVKRSVEQLRGEIDITSQRGKGTTFRLRLPLTLAIIDGFQVSVGNSIFVIPLDMVVECADMAPSPGGQKLISLRGEPLPFVRLREAFDLEPLEGARESLVVVEYGQHRAGLVVDRLLGEIQAVIKPLGRLFAGVRGIGGSTILGDGSVALILDIPSLIALSSAATESAEPTPLLSERRL